MMRTREISRKAGLYQLAAPGDEIAQNSSAHALRDRNFVRRESRRN
jgi:hypothetical protein